MKLGTLKEPDLLAAGLRVIGSHVRTEEPIWPLNILWMDEILHHLRNLGMMIPL